MARTLRALIVLSLVLGSAAACLAWTGDADSIVLSPDEIISADDLRTLQRSGTDFLLLDARNKKSYDTARIEGAKLPMTLKYYNDSRLFKEGILSVLPDIDAALEDAMKAVPRDKKIVTYCGRDCKASAILLSKLKKLGFQDVRAMEEGFQAWEEKGYPVARS